jgi:hypothetical protein
MLGGKYSRKMDSSRGVDDFQRKVGSLNLGRFLKAGLYPLLPSLNTAWHQKRRKGLAYRYSPEGVLECQQEQDRLFWSHFLKPGKTGRFLEVGGDGVVGSQTLGLELKHEWEGALFQPQEVPRCRAKRSRKCRVLGAEEGCPLEEGIDLLAIHRPSEFPVIWKEVSEGRLNARWVVVENREPDPHWAGILERSGHKLRFFFHDDEYYELKV